MAAPIVRAVGDSRRALMPRPERRKRLSGPVIALLIALPVISVGITLGAVALVQGGSSNQPAAARKPSLLPTPGPLRAAQQACDQMQTGTRVEDNSKTLIIDNAGEEDTTGLNVITLRCLLTQLAVPAAITERMYATRALDGRQEGTWDRYTASWSYHPDQGLDIIVTSR